MNKWLRALSSNQLGRWVEKGSTSILDQAFFSGANFVLSLLLARWLSPDLYGVFALSFSIYLFFTGLYNAIILEPVSVFATSKYNRQLSDYLSSQLVMHLIVTSLLGIILIVATTIFYFFDIGDYFLLQAVYGVAVSLPFLLLIWLVRRIYYILQRPSEALLSTFIYLVVVFVGALVLNSSMFRENLFFWFILLGSASLLGSLQIFFSKKLKIFTWRAISGWKRYFFEQWQFGRWIVLATLMYSLGTQSQIFIAASFLGVQAAGAFKAVQNVILPVFQIIAAMSTLMLPSVSLEFGETNFEEMRSKSIYISTLLLIIALVYEVALLLGGEFIINFVYMGKYAEYVWLIPVIGLIPIFNAVQTGFSLILRSLRKPVFYVVDKTLTGIIGVTSAFIFIAYWSVPGAVYSLLLVELATLFTYWWLYRKWFVVLLRANV